MRVWKRDGEREKTSGSNERGIFLNVHKFSSFSLPPLSDCNVIFPTVSRVDSYLAFEQAGERANLPEFRMEPTPIAFASIQLALLDH